MVNFFFFILHHNMMLKVKIAIARKAKDIYRYRNIKRNANFFFNKWCLQNGLTPNYANIKIPNTTKSVYFIYQPEDDP
jgi:hypothetical protein